MTHADSAFLPQEIAEGTKKEFWEHIYTQISALIDGERNWVSNLANASALIYHSLQSFHLFGSSDRAVNWCGFYIKSSFHPSIQTPTINSNGNSKSTKLLLGPFCGKPACQFIRVTDGPPLTPGTITGGGVCADAFASGQAVLVNNVDEYEGHIACDGETKAEIVIPLVTSSGKRTGVLDLDCVGIGAFGDEDKQGLQRISELLANGCDWIEIGERHNGHTD